MSILQFKKFNPIQIPMKKTILLILLMAASFVFSQTNTIQIINFSQFNIKFTLISNNSSVYGMDCVPVIFNEDPVTLLSGNSVTYSQHNLSQNVIPAITKWRVYSANGNDTTYDLLTGATVPLADYSLTSWATIEMFTPAGEQVRLGRFCSPNATSGYYTLPSGYTINASWSTLNGNVLVVIT